MHTYLNGWLDGCMAAWMGTWGLEDKTVQLQRGYRIHLTKNIHNYNLLLTLNYHLWGRYYSCFTGAVLQTRKLQLRKAQRNKKKK